MSELSEQLLKAITAALTAKTDLLLSLISYLSINKDQNLVSTLQNFHTSNPALFDQLCIQMAHDVTKARNDKDYAVVISSIYSDYIKGRDLSGSNFQLELNLNEASLSTIQYNMLRTISRLEPSTQAQVIRTISALAEKTNLLHVTKFVNGPLSKVVNSKYAAEALLAVYLAYEAIKSIREWWNGDITGKRCAKQIVDSFASAVGGVGGGIVGAGVGTLAGPIGIVVGSVVGGILGSVAAGELSSWLTCQLFNLPKDKALENAFKFLGVTHRATNQEINKRFRELCLEHHPDKGGNAQEFHKLQCSMAIIRLSKGEV